MYLLIVCFVYICPKRGLERAIMSSCIVTNRDENGHTDQNRGKWRDNQRNI